MTRTLHEKRIESEKIITEAFKRFQNLGIAFSGGSDSLVLLNLILPYDAKIKVLFVNTYDQFPETYRFIGETRRENNLNLFEFKAERNRHKEFSKIKEKARRMEICCRYHKIEPFLRGIEKLKLDGVFVGIRASEHEERAKASFFERKKGHTRIHPLLSWTIQNILDFITLYGLKTNLLYEKGYASLGCKRCTKKVKKIVERGGRDKTRETIMRVLREAGYT